MVLCEAIAARQEEALFVANDTVFILLGEQRPQIFAGATGASRVIGITNRRDACSKRYKAGAAVAK